MMNITDDDKRKELSRNIIIAASSIIPGLGGVLSLFLDKYLPSTIEKRKEDFLLSLSNDFERLPSTIIKELSTNEEYHSIILKVFKAVIQEEKEVKLIAFRNILINVALCDDSVNEREFYIKLLTELTTDQIKILHLFYLRDYKKELEFTNTNKYISKHWHNVDESYRFALVTELIRYGLISGSKKLQKINGSGDYLSPFGDRFIRYIFNPNEPPIEE